MDSPTLRSETIGSPSGGSRKSDPDRRPLRPNQHGDGLRPVPAGGRDPLWPGEGPKGRDPLPLGRDGAWLGLPGGAACRRGPSPGPKGRPRGDPGVLRGPAGLRRALPGRDAAPGARGVSTRDYGEAVRQIEGGLGLSKSSVSRAFEAGSLKAIEEINGRDLKGIAWAAIFLDGTEFQGTHILAALGVAQDGRKVLLGLREGASENSEVARDLVVSIRERGFSPEGTLLTILDGSKALAKAVRQVFGEGVLMSLLHKPIDPRLIMTA